MITRFWRGWTAPEQSLAYEQLLTDSIAPSILERGILGLRELTVLRRDPQQLTAGSGSEVMTVMSFDDLEAITAFAGGDPAASVVPPAARALLQRFDAHSQHYTTVATFRATAA